MRQVLETRSRFPSLVPAVGLLAVGLVLAMVGCGEGPTEPEVLTLFVGPERVECVGEGPRTCLLVKESRDAEFELFYDEIEGFAFEPGFLWELRVRRHRIADPPADGSAFRWELLEVLSKVPAQG